MLKTESLHDMQFRCSWSVLVFKHKHRSTTVHEEILLDPSKNGQQYYMKMLKWFVMSCVALLNKMLFDDLGVGKMFCSSTMLVFDCDEWICF